MQIKLKRVNVCEGNLLIKRDLEVFKLLLLTQKVGIEMERLYVTAISTSYARECFVFPRIDYSI